jgi:hypothetical protein
VQRTGARSEDWLESHQGDDREGTRFDDPVARQIRLRRQRTKIFNACVVLAGLGVTAVISALAVSWLGAP